MKIVLTSYVYSKGYADPEKWLKRISFYTGILDALVSNGNEVISIEQIDHEGTFNQNGVNYLFVKLSQSGRRIPVKLHSLIKKQHPDVVIVQGLHSPLQVILLRFSLGFKVKILLQNHAERPFTNIKRHLHKWADKYVDAYLFASKQLGLSWVRPVRLISEEKIHEVMEVSSTFCPIARNDALQRTGIIGIPAFLWVGRLNQNKDPLTVVRAFLEFTRINASAKLYMIYQTDELLPEIKNLLHHHPNKDSITLVGKVANDDLLYWYNSVDFLLSGSHYEGSGTVVCEAMSCGCIPIVTDIASFRMITDNGSCGCLYEAGNIDALVNTLLQSRRLDMVTTRQKCLDRFAKKLSFKAIARDIELVANSIVK